MKILHQLGHQHKWPLDAYFKNNIGDGFIIGARNIERDAISTSLSGYKPGAYLPHSFIDLQFYGNKNSIGGKLNTYGFHPINHKKSQETVVSIAESVIAAINFQEKLGVPNIIVPNICIDNEDIEKSFELIKTINTKVKKYREENKSTALYFFTVPINGVLIHDDKKIEALLQVLTDMEIGFDGFYIVCETNVETQKKISFDLKYYLNLNKILSTLKKQGFKTILGFANVDALVFTALNDIDYITIGTYENLRNFKLEHFTTDISGGMSKGWYYSEKIINFISANQLELFHTLNVIDIIRNEDNIFSDTILTPGYPWNTHRPDVHKNYLLAISRQLKMIATGKTSEEKISILRKMIESASETYKEIEKTGIVLDDVSKNYHFSTWLTALNRFSNGRVVLE